MVGEAIKSCPVRKGRSGASAGVGKAACSVAGSKIAAAIAPRRCREIKDIAPLPSSRAIASIAAAAAADHPAACAHQRGLSLADRNFFDYPLLGIDEMPEIVPIVLPSDRPPQGFGDPSRSEAAMSKKEA
jgi:hypothetical protein